MSHLSVYKTDLKNVTTTFLINAINQFVKNQPGLQICNKLTGYASGAKIDIGIKGTGCQNGIGFSVENGQLVIKGDAWGQDREFNRLKDLVPSYMRAMIVARNAPNVFGAKLRGIKTSIQQDRVVQVLEVCE
jgi:hypothetical protein